MSNEKGDNKIGMRHIKLSIFKINLLFNTFLTKKIFSICEIGKIWIIPTKAERLRVSKNFFSS